MTDRALWVAKTGLDAQQTRMAVISNNLANINTIGFKKGRAAFEDLLYQNVRQVGAQSSQTTQLPSGLQLGTGVRIVATEKLHTQGNIIETGNVLDVAINGRGFFQVLLPDGSLAYTRDGSFKLNSEGQLVTASGYFLEPAITIPQGATSITIGKDGIVSVTVAGDAAPQQVGQIQLADFINPTGLEPLGENLYRESVASGPPTVGNPGENERGALIQGSLETSNVNVVEEMVNMIETQRAYELNSKAISTTDQMLAFITNNL
jgi:flagellar basal-body rod protein FlgG